MPQLRQSRSSEVRVLGSVRYKDSLGMAAQLRRAMVRSGRDRLRGRIEVDETIRYLCTCVYIPAIWGQNGT